MTEPGRFCTIRPWLAIPSKTTHAPRWLAIYLASLRCHWRVLDAVYRAMPQTSQDEHAKHVFTHMVRRFFRCDLGNRPKVEICVNFDVFASDGCPPGISINAMCENEPDCRVDNENWHSLQYDPTTRTLQYHRGYSFKLIGPLGFPEAYRIVAEKVQELRLELLQHTCEY
jgi:hypothetical protein